MKRFLIEILCAGGIVLILLYAIQFGIDKKARHTYSTLPYRTLNMVRDSHAIDADVVVFGNCRAQCHYHSEIMDSILQVNCYNLGFWGRSFDHIYNLLIVPYMEHNVQPKLCIIEVCPQEFFDLRHPHYVSFMSPYLNEKYSKFYVNICDEINILDLYLPVKYYATKQTMDEMFFASNLKYKDSFAPIEGDEYCHNFQYDIYELERNDKVIQYFTCCVEDCRSRGIPLLFVCSPMHKKDFYDHCEMDKFWALIDSLAPDVPVLDYSLIFGSDTTYFAASTRVNAHGADSFSIKLAHDIDSIGFLR